MPITEVIAALHELHKYGIIQYSPPSDKQQIFLIQNRMYNDDFKFDAKKIAERRTHFEDRVKAITKFVKENVHCRSKMIANYFGDKDIKDCGICDNCINKKDRALKAEKFNVISTAIIKVLKERPMKLEALKANLIDISQDNVWKTIEFLLAEKIIETDGDQKFIISR